ncbi:site-specific integrase [Hymenobacter lucidus]|uniref:Site-specific integrase n=1 Tax=Hymenobacter lucidus TaxID=2880930 RepID=A0ABS8AYS0_9BACT|nr:site-specific integrase [Hymenobacter lucidus]MCB2410965.1 site-specific integrase [Hymenobacter lucidus]
MEKVNALTVNPVGHGLSHHTGAAARYVEAGLTGAPNTARAYGAHLKRFSAWCIEQGYEPLPATVDALVGFCTHLAEAGKKVGTLEQHCAAISKAHAVRGVDSPTDDRQFKIFMDGVRRVHGVRQKQAPAFSLIQLKQLVRSLDVETVTGLRDRAILLLGFTGAFRRSELTALNVQDLRFTEECLVVSLGKSKTNQLGDYEEKAIFYSPESAVCPIRSLKAWLGQLERSEGPVFVMLRKGNRLTNNRLSDQTINTLVQRYLGPGYTAHSLRASFVTVAKLNGADDSKIMNQTKHKTSAMIRRYTRLDNVQQHNAAKELGL